MRMKRNFILSAIIGLLTIEAFPVDDVNTLSSVPLYMFLSFITLVTLFYYYKCKYRKNVKHIFGNDYILKLYFFWVVLGDYVLRIIIGNIKLFLCIQCLC